MIDFDFNGTLSADELKQHLGEHISKEYYQNLIRFFDDDHDGEVRWLISRSVCRSLSA